MRACDRVGIQTPNLLIRSETLYSVELRSQLDCKIRAYFLFDKYKFTNFLIHPVAPDPRYCRIS